MKSKIAYLVFFIILPFCFINAQEKEQETVFPTPIGYVNDFEGLYTPEQIEELEKLITDFENETTNEIAIITIDNIGGYTDFYEYALDLSKKWGVGKADKNNGLIIIFSKTLRKVRINTGTGTQQVISDEFCKKLIDNYLIPNFKANKYYDGSKETLLALFETWK